MSEFWTTDLHLTNKCPKMSVVRFKRMPYNNLNNKLKWWIIMKHTVTTYNTKRMLADSLKKAMKEKSFSKITVSEIIQDCGVNRKTFYYHFEDIYALLKWMFDEEAIEVVMHFDLLVDYEEAIHFIMNYVDENEYIISCAYNSIGREEMKRFFCADFLGIITTVIDSAEIRIGKRFDPDFKEYVAKFYTEALAGMLIDWIQQKDKHDREKVAGYLTTIIATALDNIYLVENQKNNH
ncbi:MAG: TetR family transcriptional regulator [Clostridiales bacterium]|nr:TetR family transcriptional regulator [Clostridiales bacterium]